MKNNKGSGTGRRLMKVIHKLLAFVVVLLSIFPLSVTFLEIPPSEEGAILVTLNVCNADTGILTDGGSPAVVDLPQCDFSPQICLCSYSSAKDINLADLVLSPKYPPPELPLP